jgi:hypothetical protein
MSTLTKFNVEKKSGETDRIRFRPEGKEGV